MNILGLLRHGPTAWNRSKRIQGTRDIPLDTFIFSAGPWQQLLAKYGPWDEIVTSSLIRCLQTSDLLLPGQPHEVDPNLREQDWGDWTGHTLRQINVKSPGSIADQERRGWDFTPPGGESRREVLARILTAIHRATQNRDGQHILIITHLGVIKVLLNHLGDTPFLPGQSAPVAKRALHLLRQDGPKLSILQTNIEIP